MFISPRNQIKHNRNMLVKAGCKTLLHAKELDSTAASLQECLPELELKRIQSVDDMLQIDDGYKHYPFDKSFDEAQNEPCLILHSSGSTGMKIEHSLSF